jgi:glucose/arabinose dehydrogenase
MTAGRGAAGSDDRGRGGSWTAVALEPVAEGLDFPTAMAFLPDGRMLVAESGLPFGGARPGGRVVEIRGDGTRRTVLDGLPPPVTGLTALDDDVVVSVPGELLRLTADGVLQTLLSGLPQGGNYHVNQVAPGPDGWLYFGQGAMTNSGVVGLDSSDIGWLRRHDHPADVPGLAVELTDAMFLTEDPTAPGTSVATSAFSRFGTSRAPGTRLEGRLPCTAAVMRVRPDGSHLELVAWGTRNPFGLAFLPDGRLLALDQGADDRGSRPIGDAPDLLLEIRRGDWCGWPDFVGDEPVTDPRYTPARGPAPGFLIADHAALPRPRAPLVRFPPHAAATRIALAPDDLPGEGAMQGNPAPWTGRLLCTLFGDERPMTAPEGPRSGRCLAMVDLAAGTVDTLVSAPLLRPIDVVVAPGDHSVHVVDFGYFEMGPRGSMQASSGTGRLWRVVDQAG